MYSISSDICLSLQVLWDVKPWQCVVVSFQQSLAAYQRDKGSEKQGNLCRPHWGADPGSLRLLVTGHVLRDASSGDTAQQAPQSMLAQKKLTVRSLGNRVSGPWLVHDNMWLGTWDLSSSSYLCITLKHKGTRGVLFKDWSFMGTSSLLPDLPWVLCTHSSVELRLFVSDAQSNWGLWLVCQYGEWRACCSYLWLSWSHKARAAAGTLKVSVGKGDP